MSLYILDTDHVTLWQHNHAKILEYIETIDDSNIFVTIIIFEEQLQGRLAVINKANNKPEKLTHAYKNLQQTFIFLCSVNLLEFDESAYNHYQNLRQQRIRIGSQDLKIAAIALSNQGTVITRNEQDFQQVPNLFLENWTI